MTDSPPTWFEDAFPGLEAVIATDTSCADWQGRGVRFATCRRQGLGEFRLAVLTLRGEVVCLLSSLTYPGGVVAWARPGVDRQRLLEALIDRLGRVFPAIDPWTGAPFPGE